MKAKRIIFLLCLAVAASLLTSCKAKPDVAESFLKKKLIIPEQFSLGNGNKVLTYFDMLSCSSCSLKEITLWEDIILEFEDLRNSSGRDAEMVFVIESQETEAILEAFSPLERFADVRVIYDAKGVFKEHNILPDDEVYQSFLLDGNNKIHLIGKPIFNKELWHKYKAYLFKE